MTQLSESQTPLCETRQAWYCSASAPGGSEIPENSPKLWNCVQIKFPGQKKKPTKNRKPRETCYPYLSHFRQLTKYFLWCSFSSNAKVMQEPPLAHGTLWQRASHFAGVNWNSSQIQSTARLPHVTHHWIYGPAPRGLHGMPRLA